VSLLNDRRSGGGQQAWPQAGSRPGGLARLSGPRPGGTCAIGLGHPPAGREQHRRERGCRRSRSDPYLWAGAL